MLVRRPVADDGIVHLRQLGRMQELNQAAIAAPHELQGRNGGVGYVGSGENPAQGLVAQVNDRFKLRTSTNPAVGPCF